MNVKQKVGFGIMAPLFAFSVGHTVVNKIYSDKEAEKIENTNKRNRFYSENLYYTLQKVDSLKSLIINTNKNDTKRIKELSEELVKAQNDFIVFQNNME